MNNENKQLLKSHINDIKNELDLISNYLEISNIENLNKLLKDFKKDWKNIKGGF